MWRYDWSFPGMPLRTVGSSVVSGDLVFGCAGDGNGERGMVAVRLDGKGNVTRTHMAWSKGSGTPYVPTLLVREGHLYGVLDTGMAICFEAATGKVAWQKRMCGSVSSSPVMIDGKVYVIDEMGSVCVYEANPTELKLLAKNSVGETVRSSPAVANGRLYIRGINHLFCIGK